MLKSFFHRHQPLVSQRHAALAGLGGALAIAVVGSLTALSGWSLIMAPFGASCVLLFSVPDSPLSQPMNVIGGHAIATLIGLLLAMVLPDVWWTGALGVGIAISAMAVLRVTHPPAGADPLVVLALQPGWSFLILPVVLGAVALVGVAVAYHRLSGKIYPKLKS